MTPESLLLKEVKSILDSYQLQQQLFYFRINTGATIIKNRFMKNRSTTGFSDLLILIKNGLTLFAELKAHKGHLTEKQIEFKNIIEKSGGSRRYVVWYSAADAIRDIENILSQRDV